MRTWATILVLAFAANADEMLVHLSSGEFFHATILGSTPDSVGIRRKTDDGGEETLTLSVDQCDKWFFYQVRDKTLGDDAKGRIQLAKWCVQNDMFSRAKVQMSRARAADEKVVEEFMKTEFPKIKEGLGKRIFDVAKRSWSRGSAKNAKMWCSLILTKFEGTKVEPEAEALLEEIHKKLEEEEERKQKLRRKAAAAQAEREAKIKEDKRDKELAPVERLMREGRQANHTGLKAKNLSQAKSAFETAASRFKHAIKRADQGLKDTKDEQVAKGLQEMRGEATENAIEVYLNLANTYASRGSDVKASQYCNQALALDPENASAKSLRASLGGGGWGRRRGGRR